MYVNQNFQTFAIGQIHISFYKTLETLAFLEKLPKKTYEVYIQSVKSSLHTYLLTSIIHLKKKEKKRDLCIGILDIFLIPDLVFFPFQKDKLLRVIVKQN